MSRFLANKISIASRIDCFSDAPSTKFGEVMANQVEERLQFYESGKPPGKNADAMSKALRAIEEEAGDLMDVDAQDESDDESDDEDAIMPAAVGVVDPADKKKSSKKDKSEKKDKKKKSKGGDKDTLDEVERAAEKARKKAAKKAARKSEGGVPGDESIAKDADVSVTKEKKSKKEKKEKKKSRSSMP